MKLDPINLIGGFYQDDNLPWSAQDTVNWIPRPAEMPGTISQMKLAGAPGLELLVQIDDEPVRIGGFRNVEGRMFIVAGTTLYELNTDLTTTVRGTIPGAGPVTMAHNQLEFGNELCIGNGSGTLYVWNTWTSTFTVVSDDAATGSVQSVYLNRRIIHLDPFGRFGYPSDIDSATSYDSLDRFDSEASPDKLVGIGVSQFELVAISQRTTEFYSDTGATEQPFRPKRIAINRGCAARNSIVQLGGTLAMLGDDGIFYRLQGYQWEPISTGPVNKAIAGNNWANCFGFVYEDRKHEIAYWTFPDGQTWGYDAWTGLIHRRESFGLNRWRINAIEKWNDMWIAGDFQSGRIYRIDWDTYHENGQPLVASRTAPPIYNNGNPVVCPLIELVFDTGRGGPDPLGVTGDLPDGIAGTTSGTMQYAITGGIGPYTVQVIDGALPAGASMSDSGLVTYAYTTLGRYSWTIKVTDAFGDTATFEDDAVVSALQWDFLWTRETTSNVGGLNYSPVTWGEGAPRVAYTNGSSGTTWSDTGATWATPTLLAGTNINPSAWSPTLNKAVLVRTGATNTVYTSTDLKTWAVGTYSGESDGASCIVWDAFRGTFFSVGGTSAAWRRSSNGTTWSSGIYGAGLGPDLALDMAVSPTGRYVVGSVSSQTQNKRLAWSDDGGVTWSFATTTGDYATDWVSVNYLTGGLFGVVGDTGAGAGRRVLVGAGNDTWTDVTPAGLLTNLASIAHIPELNMAVLIPNTSSSSAATYYTSTYPISSGSWVARTNMLGTGGNYHQIRWCGAPIYKLIAISTGGASGNGVIYSNTILVTPP